MTIRKIRFITRVMPSRQDAISMGSQAIANGKLSSHDAQELERLVNGNRVIPADLLHRVKQGAKG